MRHPTFALSCPPTPDLILDTAADLLDEHGWCAGQPTSDSGAICAYAAIKMAVTGDPCAATLHVPARHRELVFRTACVLAGYLQLPGLGLARWNDEQPDQQHVTAALRAAAEQFRQHRDGGLRPAAAAVVRAA